MDITKWHVGLARLSFIILPYPQKISSLKEKSKSKVKDSKN